MQQFFSLFNNYTFVIVALGSALLGLVSGLIGTFAVLKKQSLLGDAVSHSALPGLALVFLLTGAKQTELLLLGALASGIIAVFLISGIVKRSKITYDTALALVMSVLFGLGMVLLTVIQKIPSSNQAGIKNYIFGQAASVLKEDVILISVISVVILGIIILFWKEFKLFAFDPEYAKSIGFSTKKLNLILSFMIVLTIIAGLQTVGVILMSSMLIAPAVAARQWSDRLSVVVILSAVIGAMSGIIGTGISSAMSKMPTGPSIVVVVSVIVFISLLFAPKRGVLSRIISKRKDKREFNKQLLKSREENL